MWPCLSVLLSPPLPSPCLPLEKVSHLFDLHTYVETTTSKVSHASTRRPPPRAACLSPFSRPTTHHAPPCPEISFYEASIFSYLVCLDCSLGTNSTYVRESEISLAFSLIYNYLCFLSRRELQRALRRDLHQTFIFLTSACV